jgi:hypothetical protein
MNDTQLYLAIGIPTVTVILAWLSNKSDINRLNDKVDRLGETLRADMTALRADISKDFVAFRREIHQDMIVLHERVVKVETKQDM